MARVRRDTDLGSRDARRRLKARPEPYFRVIERGLSVGYRKSAEGGSWVVRRYRDSSKRHHEERIATADDFRDADGVEVLDFGQAQRKALAEAKLKAEKGSGKGYTVADAVDDYVAFLEAERKTAKDAKAKLRAYVVERLGAVRLAELKPPDFADWKTWALKRASTRGRKRKNANRAADIEKPVESKAPEKPADAAEAQRRRKSTLNRVIASLLACLNMAYRNKKVASREAWSELKKFRAVDSARTRWLTEDEATRLLNAAAPDLRVLVRAALLTGCREGELLAARVREFDAKSNTLLVPVSKSGKPRHLPLTDAGVSLFKTLTAGKAGSDPIFLRADKSPWYRLAVLRGMAKACRIAKIDDPVTFYTLRHTYASHLVQQGTPLLFVASALGHRDSRMVEKHYAHLADSHVADSIQANLPAFRDASTPTNVSDLRHRQRSKRS